MIRRPTIQASHRPRRSRPARDPNVVARTADGRAVTRQKALVLAELATWPTGTGSLSGKLDGGSLAALVQLGLAERAEADRIGGCRYRISPAGEQLLRDLGVLHEARPA